MGISEVPCVLPSPVLPFPHMKRRTSLLVKLWRGGSCYLEAVPTCGPKTDLDRVRMFQFLPVSWGRFPAAFCWSEPVQGESYFPECFTRHGSLWEEIGWKEKQLMRTPSSPSLTYRLSASLALTSSSHPEGAEYRHLCFAAGLHVISFGHLCRWTGNAPFFLAILHSFQFCAVRMPALQGFSTHFFSAFLLSAVLCRVLFYIHSLVLVPDMVSGFRKDSWGVAVVVKDG